MDKKIVITGGILGVLAIILGAFGAHGLEKVVTADSITSFVTGVRYQMYHALLLLFLGQTVLVSEAAKRIVFYLVLVGVILFSGSIYLLAIDEVLGVDVSAIGFITPLAGITLIMGWIFLIKGFLNHKPSVA